MQHLSEIVEEARKKGKKRLAVAYGQDAHTLAAVYAAYKEGLVEPILFGDPKIIEQVCKEENIDCNIFKIIPESNDVKCVNLAVNAVVTGEADVLMKGLVSTDKYMRGILNKDAGLFPPKGTLSHVAVVEMPNYPKLLVISDVAVIPQPDFKQKTILIAPSWQEDNIVDSCLEDILQKLRATGYKVIVRPHPQHVRHMPEKMQLLKDKFAEDKNIEIQTDFSSNDTVFNADLIITDWSGIAYEYAFTTLRPVLYINTPMKIMNPEYEKIGVVPINIFMRDSIGCSLNLDQLDRVADEATRLIEQRDLYHDKIDAFVKQYVYHLGTSAKVGANYIKLRLKQIHSEE